MSKASIVADFHEKASTRRLCMMKRQRFLSGLLSTSGHGDPSCSVCIAAHPLRPLASSPDRRMEAVHTALLACSVPGYPTACHPRWRRQDATASCWLPEYGQEYVRTHMRIMQGGRWYRGVDQGRRERVAIDGRTADGLLYGCSRHSALADRETLKPRETPSFPEAVHCQLCRYRRRPEHLYGSCRVSTPLWRTNCGRLSKSWVGRGRLRGHRAVTTSDSRQDSGPLCHQRSSPAGSQRLPHRPDRRLSRRRAVVSWMPHATVTLLCPRVGALSSETGPWHECQRCLSYVIA